MHGLGLAVLRSVLYGKSPARRGASHKAAVALGLKRQDLCVTDSPAPEDLSRPDGAMDALASLALGPGPTGCDQEKIKLLRRHPAARVEASPAAVPDGFDMAGFARRNGWDPGTVRQTVRRHAGSTRMPAHHTLAWRICAALSMELGGEVCMGMAGMLAELRKTWAGHITGRQGEVPE